MTTTCNEFFSNNTCTSGLNRNEGSVRCVDTTGVYNSCDVICCITPPGKYTEFINTDTTDVPKNIFPPVFSDQTYRRYINIKNDSGNVDKAYCEIDNSFTYPEVSLKDNNGDNITGDYSSSIIINQVQQRSNDGTLTDVNNLYSVTKDNSIYFQENGYPSNDYMDNTGDYNINNYILEKTFERDIDNILNSDCVNLNEDECNSDIACKWDDTIVTPVCKSIIDYCKVNNDASRSLPSDCVSKSADCYWSLSKRNLSTDNTFNPDVLLDIDDTRLLQIKNILGNLQSLRIGQELTRESDFYGKAQFGCGVDYENLKKFLHPLRFIDHKAKSRSSKIFQIGVCEMPDQHDVYHLNPDAEDPGGDCALINGEYKIVNDPFCEIVTKASEYYDAYNLNNPDSRLGLAAPSGMGGQSTLNTAQNYYNRKKAECLEQNEKYIHGFCGLKDASGDCSSSSISYINHQSHFYKKEYIDKYLELFKNACFYDNTGSLTGSCVYNLDKLIDEADPNIDPSLVNISSICTAAETDAVYTPHVEGRCIQLNSDGTNKDNTQCSIHSISIKPNYTNLFGSYYNANDYYHELVNNECIINTNRGCTGSNSNVCENYRKTDTDYNLPDIFESVKMDINKRNPDKGNILGPPNLCNWDGATSTCSTVSMNADECAAIENAIWIEGEKGKCKSTDLISCVGSFDKEIYYDLDDNMKPNLSYITSDTSNKYFIDQNDAYKAYFNLNYDDFCDFSSHYNTEPTLDNMCGSSLTSRQQCPRNCENKTSPYTPDTIDGSCTSITVSSECNAPCIWNSETTSCEKQPWIDSWNSDPKPDSGLTAKIHHSIPRGICIDTSTQEEKPFYDSNSCISPNTWFTTNGPDNQNHYLKSSPYLSNCETVYNADQKPFTAKDTTSNFHDYITRNISSNCPVINSSEGGISNYYTKTEYKPSNPEGDGVYIFSSPNILDYGVPEQGYVDQWNDALCEPSLRNGLKSFPTYMGMCGVTSDFNFDTYRYPASEINQETLKYAGNINNINNIHNFTNFTNFTDTDPYSQFGSSPDNLIHDKFFTDKKQYFHVSKNRYPNEPLTDCVSRFSNTFDPTCAELDLSQCTSRHISVDGPLCKRSDNKADSSIDTISPSVNADILSNTDSTSNYFDHKCSAIYDNCLQDGSCSPCITSLEGFSNKTTFNTTETCYLNTKYRKYYDCMYGLPLQKPQSSSSIKSNLGSSDIYGRVNLADEGVWTPFKDHLNEYGTHLKNGDLTDFTFSQGQLDISAQNFNRKQYGIQNNLNLGEIDLNNYQGHHYNTQPIVYGNSMGNWGIFYHGGQKYPNTKSIAELGKTPIKSKHIWNVNMDEICVGTVNIGHYRGNNCYDVYNNTNNIADVGYGDRSNSEWCEEENQGCTLIDTSKYKDVYNGYNTTFYGNVEDGILLSLDGNEYGKFPYCKMNASDQTEKYIMNCGTENVRENIDNKHIFININEGNSIKELPNSIKTGTSSDNGKEGKIEKYIFSQEGGSLNYNQSGRYFEDPTKNNVSGLEEILNTVITNTGSFYGYIMDNFGKNPTSDQGILVKENPVGSGTFISINPLDSYYTSRDITASIPYYSEGSWTNVLNNPPSVHPDYPDDPAKRYLTCGSVIDFLYSLKHINTDTIDSTATINDKYDNISDELCNNNSITIGDSDLSLPIEPSVMEYLLTECGICSSKPWVQAFNTIDFDNDNIDDLNFPGECVPSGNIDIDNRINLNKNDVISVGSCLGDWTKKDFINSIDDPNVIVDGTSKYIIINSSLDYCTTLESFTEEGSTGSGTCTGSGSTPFKKIHLDNDITSDLSTIIKTPFYEIYTDSPDTNRNDCKFIDTEKRYDADAPSGTNAVIKLCDGVRDDSLVYKEIINICDKKIEDLDPNLLCGITNYNTVNGFSFTYECDGDMTYVDTSGSLSCQPIAKCPEEGDSSISYPTGCNQNKIPTNHGYIINGTNITNDDERCNFCFDYPNCLEEDSSITRDIDGTCQCSVIPDYHYDTTSRMCEVNICNSPGSGDTIISDVQSVLINPTEGRNNSDCINPLTPDDSTGTDECICYINSGREIDGNNIQPAVSICSSHDAEYTTNCDISTCNTTDNDFILSDTNGLITTPIIINQIRTNPSVYSDMIVQCDYNSNKYYNALGLGENVKYSSKTDLRTIMSDRGNILEDIYCDNNSIAFDNINCVSCSTNYDSRCDYTGSLDGHKECIVDSIDNTVIYRSCNKISDVYKIELDGGFKNEYLIDYNKSESGNGGGVVPCSKNLLDTSILSNFIELNGGDDIQTLYSSISALCTPGDTGKNDDYNGSSIHSILECPSSYYLDTDSKCKSCGSVQPLSQDNCNTDNTTECVNIESGVVYKCDVASFGYHIDSNGIVNINVCTSDDYSSSFTLIPDQDYYYKCTNNYPDKVCRIDPIVEESIQTNLGCIIKVCPVHNESYTYVIEHGDNELVTCNQVYGASTTCEYIGNKRFYDDYDVAEYTTYGFNYFGSPCSSDSITCLTPDNIGYVYNSCNGKDICCPAMCSTGDDFNYPTDCNCPPDTHHATSSNIRCIINSCPLDTTSAARNGYNIEHTLEMLDSYTLNQMNSDGVTKRCASGYEMDSDGIVISCDNINSFEFSGCNACIDGKYSLDGGACQECTFSNCSKTTGLPSPAPDDSGVERNGVLFYPLDYCPDGQLLEIDSLNNITNTCINISSISGGNFININSDSEGICSKGYTQQDSDRTFSYYCEEIECGAGKYENDNGVETRCASCTGDNEITYPEHKNNDDPSYMNDFKCITEKSSIYRLSGPEYCNDFNQNDRGNYIYYDQRVHEEKYCQGIDNKYDCNNNTNNRCKFYKHPHIQPTLRQCHANPENGFETCCREVINSDDSSKYYCKKLLGERSDALELHKSECDFVTTDYYGNIDPEADTNTILASICTNIKNDEGQSMCQWDSTELKCNKIQNTSNLKCKDGYILNYDSDSNDAPPTYLSVTDLKPNIYEHPFCCVDTTMIENDGVRYDWDTNSDCKHGYGYDYSSNNTCLRVPWLRDIPDDNPYREGTKVTCSILGSPNLTADGSQYDYTGIDSPSLFANYSLVGRYEDYQRINSIDQFIENENVFVPSILYNDTANSTDDVFCNYNYHSNYLYNSNDLTSEIRATQFSDIVGQEDGVIKQFRINNRDITDTHELCQRTFCMKPTGQNDIYLDTNESGRMFKDELFEDETIDKIKCNTSLRYYSEGDRYLVTLLKRNDKPFTKIYIKFNERGPEIVKSGYHKTGGLWYKIPVPDNVDIDRIYSVIVPIILVEEEDIDTITEEYYGSTIENSLYSDIKYVDGGVGICNVPGTDYIYDGCEIFDKTCNDWIEDNPGMVTITKENDAYCSNGSLIDKYRRILNYDDINIETKEEICCNDKTCSSYICPPEYEKIIENNNLLIYNDSGIPIPLDKCCTKKSCNDWFQDNVCPSGFESKQCYSYGEIKKCNGSYIEEVSNEIKNCQEEYNSKDIESKNDWCKTTEGCNFIDKPDCRDLIGFGTNKCCYETCKLWNKRTIGDNLENRFPNIPRYFIDDNILEDDFINNNDITNENIFEQLNRLIGENNYIDTGTPEVLTSCSIDENILYDKKGNSNFECCVNKKNSCNSKLWECPDNMYNNYVNSGEKCEKSSDDDSDCPETSINIELCCKSYEKCKDMTCPNGYTNNRNKLEQDCNGPICNVDDDMSCCVEKEKCSKLNCGYGKSKNLAKKDVYCKGERCNYKEDGNTCCSENETCKNMQCPLGYFNIKENDNKKCFKNKCNTDNSLDMLKCCKQCVPVKNSKFYECDNKEGSYPLECNDGFIIDGNSCVKAVDTIEISMKLDGDFDTFMLNNKNPDSLIKTAICNSLSGTVNLENCINMIKVDGYEKGSIIVNFRIENEILSNEESNSNRIPVESIKTALQKGTLVKDLDMEVKDEIIVIEKNYVEDNREQGKVFCYSDIYKHECPFGTMLKKNASTINSSTSQECCELDWEILKIVLPLFIVMLFALWFIKKRTIG